MSSEIRLHGSCSCGRYIYTIDFPEDHPEQAQLRFTTDSAHRRSTSSLLNSYLRIPLSWYTSQTLAFFPDESHHLISRTFVPPHDPHSQRKFCGYCGTHLSYWTEAQKEEENFLHINVGSLSGKDIRALDDLGILDDHEKIERTSNPSEHVQNMETVRIQIPETHENTQTQPMASSIAPPRSTRVGEIGELKWFEELIDGSRLGKTNRSRKGFGTSADGATTVSWEISEYFDGDDQVDDTQSSTTARFPKRKIADVSDDDVRMG